MKDYEVPTMPWPQTVDYNSAIQNPAACFADAELARGQAAEGMIPGIPLSYAGNFATVYKMVCPSGAAWAVKCFTRKVDNLQQRYREISEHLNRRKRRFVVDFQYLPEGIRVEEAWYPVLKMQWVEGFTLNEFLRDRAGNAALFEQLCQLWLRLGNDMREDRMAHGDLQHGNVLLVPGSSATSMLLRLVDYDGMWVPSLADLPPGEVGHANYQHPQRLAVGGFDEQIDRFAHLAVYTALRCLMVGGKPLWDAHDNEENLLFREADFKLPSNSKLFPKLLALPDQATATLAGHLLLASQGPLEQVPLVSDLLDGSAVVPLSAEQICRLRLLVPPSLTVAATTGVNVPGSPIAAGTIVPGSPAALEIDIPALVQQPVLTATVMDALPAEPAEVLDALPVEIADIEAVSLGGLYYRVVALPEESRPAPASAQPGSHAPRSGEKKVPPLPPLPPLPTTKATPAWTMPPAPEWLLRLGFAENGLAARLWPITLAAVATLLFTPLLLLAAWLTGVFERKTGPPDPPGAPPALAQVAPISLRAGHEQVMLVPIEREATSEPLTVRVEGLPLGVTFQPGNLPGGEGAATVRVPLRAHIQMGAFTGDVTVRLWQGLEQLDEQTARLTVTPFLCPKLDEIPRISVEAGKRRLVEVRIKPNGNTDPWKLDIRGLPAGVKFRPPPEPSPPGMVGVLIEADPVAPETVAAILKVVLLADGIPADERLVSLSVERRRKDVKIDLVVQNGIRLQAGSKTTFSVTLVRNGYTGPITLDVEDLPAGVTTSGPVSVPEGAVTAQVELRADSEIMSRLELQYFRIVARVDEKLVGTHDATFRLERTAVKDKPPERPIPEPKIPSAQEISFPAADGVQLTGTLYPSIHDVKGACVLMVGDPKKGVSRKDASWVRLAQTLQKQGSAVMTFDFRGFGESRSGKDVNPEVFWKYQANWWHPGRKKRDMGAPELDSLMFPPSYIPWLVQDIVAARFYLDTQHDAGAVNTHNLILISAGEGATLASFWFAGELRRHRSQLLARGVIPFEGRDIIAAAWLDPNPNLGARLISRPLTSLQSQLKNEKALPPMQFIYDRKSVQAATRTRSLMKTLQQKGSTERAIGAEAVGLSGQALLEESQAQKAVTEFVSSILGKHAMRPHVLRNLRTNAWHWSLGGRLLVAKDLFAEAPGAFPVEMFGFKTR
jgi:hypothetical protein